MDTNQYGTPVAFKNTNSSNIKAAFISGSRLTVEFANGQRYQFDNVSPQMVEEWSNAKSPGGWFNSTIKSAPDKYPSEKLGDVAAAQTDAGATLAEQSAALAAGTGNLAITPDDGHVNATDPTPSQDAPKAGGVSRPLDNTVPYTAAQPVKGPVEGVIPGGRHVSKRDIGPAGSRAAAATARESGNATAGIASATPDGKQAIADTQAAHEARRKNRDWHNRPWKNGPNGTTSPAK